MIDHQCSSFPTDWRAQQLAYFKRRKRIEPDPNGKQDSLPIVSRFFFLFTFIFIFEMIIIGKQDPIIKVFIYFLLLRSVTKWVENQVRFFAILFVNSKINLIWRRENSSRMCLLTPSIKRVNIILIEVVTVNINKWDFISVFSSIRWFVWEKTKWKIETIELERPCKNTLTLFNRFQSIMFEIVKLRQIILQGKNSLKTANGLEQ